jgi:hypothetical protein
MSPCQYKFRCNLKEALATILTKKLHVLEIGK